VPSKYRSQLSKAARNDLAQFPTDWPELELLVLAAAAMPVNDTDNYATFSVAGVASLSRGNITISSDDTNDPPLISPNWLESKTDQEVALMGFKVARDLAAATSITVGAEVFPGPEVETDEQILAFLRQTTYTIHHAAGSCKIMSC